MMPAHAEMPCGEILEVHPCYECNAVKFMNQKFCAYRCGKSTQCPIAGVVDYSNPACENCQHAPYNSHKRTLPAIQGPAPCPQYERD
jgi:hypothetical protein